LAPRSSRRLPRSRAVACFVPAAPSPRLTAPSLRLGWVIDDYVHRVALVGSPGTAWPPKPVRGDSSSLLGGQSWLRGNLRALLAAKAGSGEVFGPSWRPKPAPGKSSGPLGGQSWLRGSFRALLAAKAGSGEVFGPSWRPKPAPGKSSGPLGGQSRLRGSFRALLAAKAGSGEVFGLSWPPILFLGTKSRAFGRQSPLTRNRPSSYTMDILGPFV
jgi:hypothetical protein